MPTQEGEPLRWGEEWYQVVLRFDGKELEEIAKLTRLRQPVIDQVVLVWRRRSGEMWQRYASGTKGSRAEGYTLLDPEAWGRGVRGHRKSRSVFTGELGELQSWASYLPGLRLAIGDAELQLPE